MASLRPMFPTFWSYLLTLVPVEVTASQPASLGQMVLFFNLKFLFAFTHQAKIERKENINCWQGYRATGTFIQLVGV